MLAKKSREIRFVILNMSIFLFVEKKTNNLKNFDKIVCSILCIINATKRKE